LIHDRRRLFGGDHGNSTVEFALVAPLLICLALVVLQIGLAVHVRTTLAAAAADGARAASLAGAQLSAGEQRTRAVLDGNLAAGVVTGVHVTRSIEEGRVLTQVTIDARLPLVGLLGIGSMQISAHALQEHT